MFHLTTIQIEKKLGSSCNLFWFHVKNWIMLKSFCENFWNTDVWWIELIFPEYAWHWRLANISIAVWLILTYILIIVEFSKKYSNAMFNSMSIIDRTIKKIPLLIKKNFLLIIWKGYLNLIYSKSSKYVALPSYNFDNRCLLHL